MAPKVLLSCHSWIENNSLVYDTIDPPPLSMWIAPHANKSGLRVSVTRRTDAGRQPGLKRSSAAWAQACNALRVLTPPRAMWGRVPKWQTGGVEKINKQTGKLKATGSHARGPDAKLSLAAPFRASGLGLQKLCHEECRRPPWVSNSRKLDLRVSDCLSWVTLGFHSSVHPPEESSVIYPICLHFMN